MTRWLQAAKQEADDGTELTEPTKPHHKPDKSVLSVLSGGGTAEPSTQPSAKPDDPDPAPYGESPGGRALTWTGRVVSLDAWRALTHWERHGPHGRHWNASIRQWDDV